MRVSDFQKSSEALNIFTQIRVKVSEIISNLGENKVYYKFPEIFPPCAQTFFTVYIDSNFETNRFRYAIVRVFVNDLNVIC